MGGKTLWPPPRGATGPTPHQGEHLRPSVGALFSEKAHVGIGQVSETGVLGQFHHRGRLRSADQVRIVEVRRIDCNRVRR